MRHQVRPLALFLMRSWKLIVFGRIVSSFMNIKWSATTDLSSGNSPGDNENWGKCGGRNFFLVAWAAGIINRTRDVCCWSMNHCAFLLVGCHPTCVMIIATRSYLCKEKSNLPDRSIRSSPNARIFRWLSLAERWYSDGAQIHPNTQTLLPEAASWPRHSHFSAWIVVGCIPSTASPNRCVWTS